MAKRRNPEYDELRFYGQSSRGGSMSAQAALNRLGEIDDKETDSRFNRIKRRQTKKATKNLRKSMADDNFDGKLNTKRVNRLYDSSMNKPKEGDAPDDYMDQYDFNRKFNPAKYSNILYNLAKGNEEVEKPVQKSLKLSRREATDVSTISKKDAVKVANASRLQGKGMTAAQAQAYNARVARAQNEANEKANFAQYQENRRIEEQNKALLDEEIKFNLAQEIKAADDYSQNVAMRDAYIGTAMRELANQGDVDEQAAYMFGKDSAQWQLDKDRYKSMETSEFKTKNDGYGVTTKVSRKGTNFAAGTYRMYPDGTVEPR